MATDALSRIPEVTSGKLLAFTIPHLVFMEDLKNELHRHPACLELRYSITDTLDTYSNFSLTVDFIL